eukprot:scaffold25099_cov90-Isochrysis_galbana.AAC.2
MPSATEEGAGSGTAGGRRGRITAVSRAQASARSARWAHMEPAGSNLEAEALDASRRAKARCTEVSSCAARSENWAAIGVRSASSAGWVGAVATTRAAACRTESRWQELVDAGSWRAHWRSMGSACPSAANRSGI